MITINAAIYDQPTRGRETYALIVKPTEDGEYEYQVFQVHENYRVSVLEGSGLTAKEATLIALRAVFEEPPEIP